MVLFTFGSVGLYCESEAQVKNVSDDVEYSNLNFKANEQQRLSVQDENERLMLCIVEALKIQAPVSHVGSFFSVARGMN